MAPPLTEVRHPITAYYSSIDPEGIKGWVSLVDWPIEHSFPHKWSPFSYRSSAGQGKFAGQRPTFYCFATQPRSLGISSYTLSSYRRNLNILGNSEIKVQSSSCSSFNIATCNSWIYTCKVNRQGVWSHEIASDKSCSNWIIDWWTENTWRRRTNVRPIQHSIQTHEEKK